MTHQDTMGTGPAGATDPGEGSFDPAAYVDELAAAPDNHELGTSLWFENERIRVFEVRLEPGQRGPFHVHDRTYFWTVVEPGRGLQRFADGRYVVRDYELAATRYLVHSEQDALVQNGFAFAAVAK